MPEIGTTPKPTSQLADNLERLRSVGEADRFGIGELRPVVADWPLVLVRNWFILAAGALVLTTIAWLYLASMPQRFAAEALIAPTRSITQVQFEPQIKTVNDGAPQPGTPVLTPERRQALVDLVRSGQIENAVIQQLTGRIPDGDLQPGQLVQTVRGELRPRSEILSISVDAASPDSAVAITNAWASAYVDQVNRIYTSSASSTSIAALRDKALQDLQQAQDALTASLKDNRVEELERQIQDREHRIAVLQSPYQSGAFTQTVVSTGLAPDAQQQTQQQQRTSSSTSAGQQPAPVDAQTARDDFRLAEVRTLDDMAQTIRRLDVSRASLQALLNEADADAGSPSDGVALTLLKAQLVSISDGLPAQAQVQLPAVSGGSREELQALADNIDRVRAKLSAEFETRRQAYEQNRAATISQLEAELRDLRAQHEQADARRKELTLKRDLASNTYDALARKAEEQHVAENTSGREVELASASTFAAPQGRDKPMILAAAAVAGLGLAAVAVLLRELFIRTGALTVTAPVATGLLHRSPNR